MPQNEINCIQIVKLISTDFRSVWWKVVLHCFIGMSKEFQIEGPQFLIAQSENIFFVLLTLKLWVFLLGNWVFEHV